MPKRSSFPALSAAEFKDDDLLPVLKKNADGSYQDRTLPKSALPKGGETNTAANVGASGLGLFKAKAGTELQFKKLKAGNNVTLTATATDEVEIAASGGGSSSGEANTASNVGTSGVGVFRQKTGADLEFRKLKAGANVSISEAAGGELEIAATGGGGGTAPSDAYSPSNKPQLRASGTPDFEPGDRLTSVPVNYRMAGPVLAGVTSGKNYRAIEIPLRSANVLGGEVIDVAVIKFLSGTSWTVVFKAQQVLTAGQSLINVPANFSVGAGEQVSAIVGSPNGAYGDVLNRFWGQSGNSYAAPYTGTSIARSDNVVGAVGSVYTVQALTTNEHRTVVVRGVSVTKGIIGPLEAADSRTAKGATASRPATSGLGPGETLTYFDTHNK